MAEQRGSAQRRAWVVMGALVFGCAAGASKGHAQDGGVPPAANGQANPQNGAAAGNNVEVDEAGLRQPYERLRASATALRQTCAAVTPGPAPTYEDALVRQIPPDGRNQPNAARAALTTALARPDGATTIALVCDAYCGRWDTSVTPAARVEPTHLDVCAFETPTLAAAAVTVDPASADAVLRHIAERLRPTTDALRAAARSLAEDTDASGSPLLAFADQNEATTQMHAGSPIGLATLGTEFLETTMSALARLIEDRARREAIGWLLENLRTHVCSVADDAAEEPAEALALAETRARWFPSLCQLARTGSFIGYGAGAQMLVALRTALMDDIRRWPGVAAGLVVARAIETDHSPLWCYRDDADATKCARITGIRDATERLVAHLMRGAEPAEAFAEYGGALHETNVRTAADGTRGFAQPGLALAACAMGVPASLRTHAPRFASIGLDRAQRTQAALLVGLTGHTPCWFMTGQGVPSDALVRDTPPPASATPFVTTERLERLSTLVRLYTTTSSSAASLEGAVDEIVAAYEGLRSVGSDTSTPPATLPSLDGTTIEGSAGEVLGAFEDYTLGVEGARIARRATAYVDAVLRLAVVSLRGAQTTLSVIGAMQPARTLPGLCASVDCASFDTTRDRGRALIGEVVDALDAISAVVHGDWSLVASRTLGSISRLATRPDLLAADDEARSEEKILEAFEPRIGRYLPVIVAIVTERDPEALAATLDELAAPVGGWRRKGHARLMVTLTSHAGLFGGMEFRWGPYGATRENGGAYGVAPTLAFPTGIELMWGRSGHHAPLGLFISLIDPLAFLQYDASNEAALPKPQLTTVLAPGLAFRIAVRDTPFSVLPFAVFRPGFRATERGVSGNGADVLQLGVTLSVDVTLLELAIDED